MSSFIVIDDDITVRSVLTSIIELYNLGEVCAEAADGLLGEELILRHKPDIVMIDLLLPLQDGISIIKKVKSLNIKSIFIMISQVSDKDMIAKAYEYGIEFFISKPINVIEVVNVIKKVKEYVSMKKTFEAIESTVMNMGRSSDKSIIKKSDIAKRALNQIMADLGILGDLGSRDIMNICTILYEDAELGEALEETQLSELLKLLQNKYSSEGRGSGADFKAIEMRMRRTVGKAMKNIAAMGIEDFSNDKFILYSSSLFDYTDVKTEMDYIRGKAKYSGKVNIKSFIKRLLVMLEQNAWMS
ncbi:MAG TPA: response regulator [Patescibacteria group bacterium]|nr:response regulator [Patescibacteria group bacterium]